MGYNRWYGVCCKYQGRVVRITDCKGKVHVGRITKVTPNRVFINPVGGATGGYGYGFFGPYGYGYGYGIALGAIAGIALAGLFFW